MTLERSTGTLKEKLRGCWATHLTPSALSSIAIFGAAGTTLEQTSCCDLEKDHHHNNFLRRSCCYIIFNVHDCTSIKNHILLVLLDQKNLCHHTRERERNTSFSLMNLSLPSHSSPTMKLAWNLDILVIFSHYYYSLSLSLWVHSMM